jgi:hypothetical protein
MSTDLFGNRTRRRPRSDTVNTKPLDDFFAALMRAQSFRMTREAAEAFRQIGAEEAHSYERPNAKCPDNHD